jgi:carboxymethylenebutenolidase
MSGLLARSDPERAAVVIFGGNPPSPERIPRVRCPVLGLYGSEDRRITDAIPSFGEATKEAGVKLMYLVRPGAQHASFNEARPQAYRAEPARDARKRVVEFFRATLRGA